MAKKEVSNIDLRNSEVEQQLNEWNAAAKRIAAMAVTVAREMQLRKLIASALNTEPKGTKNFLFTSALFPQWTAKVVNKLSYKLTNKKGETEAALEALARAGVSTGTLQALVRWEPVISASTYEDDLTPEQQSLLSAALTITSGAPELSIEAPADVAMFANATGAETGRYMQQAGRFVRDVDGSFRVDPTGGAARPDEIEQALRAKNGWS